MHYSTVKPPFSNLRVITASFSGVRIFRIFTVIIPGVSIFLDSICYFFFFFQEKWNIKLDKKSEIFMNLHGALGKVSILFNKA